MTTINEVTENLNELLTNSTNMASIFYDLFINTTPMEVSLQQYDSNNVLQTYVIPNRAMDLEIALTGTVDPEGVVIAGIGTIYVNTVSNEVFIKVNGTGNIGWQLALSADVLTSAMLSADGTMAANSDDLIPTQKAVRTFVEANSILAGDGSLINNINADNIAIGTLSNSRLSTDVTLQGNTLNAALKLVQLDSNGELPTIVNPNVLALGDITSAPTFVADTPHTAFIKGSIAPTLPTTTAGKLKNILFDFNIQPGRSFTFPTNAKWDYNSTPTLVAWPDLSLNVVTISNMILTLAGTTGQYCDLTNVPFNSIGSQTWEMIWNFTPTQVGIIQTVQNWSLVNGPQINITAANKFSIYLSSNNSTFDIANGTTGTYTVVNSANIYVKLAFTGTQYILSTSPDGTTWTADITVSSASTINSSTLTGNIRLGANLSNTTWFKGTMDLTKSSVKIAGGANMLVPSTGRYLNRIIWDTMDGGTNYKAHYSQVGV